MANYESIVPPMTAKGVFKVRKPFELLEGQVYAVTAIREFSELWNDQEDIFLMYYEDKGLTEQDYKRDVQNGVCIVALEGPLGTVYIPSSYIESYPKNAYDDYHHVVLSVSLGAIPRYLDITALRNKIRDNCVTVLGHDVKVLEHEAPTVSLITNEEGDLIERLRKGMLALGEDPALEVIRLRNKINAVLKDSNAKIEKILQKKKKKKT